MRMTTSSATTFEPRQTPKSCTSEPGTPHPFHLATTAQTAPLSLIRLHPIHTNPIPTPHQPNTKLGAPRLRRAHQRRAAHDARLRAAQQRPRRRADHSRPARRAVRAQSLHPRRWQVSARTRRAAAAAAAAAAAELCN
eukprot:539903-Prymnesium_polylepis.2